MLVIWQWAWALDGNCQALTPKEGDIIPLGTDWVVTFP